MKFDVIFISLLATSGRLYGRARSEVQKEVAVYHQGTQIAQDSGRQNQQVHIDDDVPLWGV